MALSGAQYASLTTGQIAALTTSSLALLGSEKLALLTTQQVGGLKTQQLLGLSSESLNALTTEQFAALKVTQLPSLTSGQLLSLEQADLQALSTVQIGALSSAQLNYLSTVQMGSLLTSQVRGLTTLQVGTLTSVNLNALGTSQFQALTTLQVGALKALQVASLETADLLSLSSVQLRALGTAGIAALRSEQVMALSGAQYASLTTGQIKALSNQSLAALNSAQIIALSTQQLCALTTSQKALLATTATLVGLSTSQVAAIQTSTPIILDLNGDGVRTLMMSEGVEFDLLSNGKPVQTGWVSAGDGLLVMDRNGDQSINDGAELFGSSTLLANGTKAPDGYAALSELDSNKDGVINQADEAFAKLGVWIDSNSDGQSDSGEIKTLAELGIKQLSLQVTTGDVVDHGNLLGLTSTFETVDGVTHAAADVWFAIGQPLEPGGSRSQSDSLLDKNGRALQVSQLSAAISSFVSNEAERQETEVQMGLKSLWLPIQGADQTLAEPMIKVTSLVAAMAQFVGKDAQITAPPLAGHDLAQSMRQGLRQDVVVSDSWLREVKSQK